MKKIKKRGLSMLLALCLILTMAVPALAVSGSRLSEAVEGSAAYMLSVVTEPQMSTIGGDWAIIGLARSGYEVPQEYWDSYYAVVEKEVQECQGVLHKKKYTEYSRVIIALTAIGADPTNVGGYDLLTALGDFDKTIWQGINGPIWALIALDSGNYDIPVNPEAKTQASRQMYVDEILSRQLNDGGWNLADKGGDGAADPDLTGMALQALAKYQDQSAVKEATDRALACLSNMQETDGGYECYNTANSESVVQVIVALCELGIDLEDPRFVKNGNTLMGNLLSYRLADGSFSHTGDGSGSNQMATEQGFYGIVAALRAAEGKSSLYRMSDTAIRVSGVEAPAIGLAGKHEDVNKVPVTVLGAAFADAEGHANQSAIEALASRGIITGMTDSSFAPDETMTRAQFATIVVRALGLELVTSGKGFEDVADGKWYHDFVLTASAYGIIEGRSDTEFCPEDTITKQEAATMVARAAKLCGMDTELSSSETRDMLAQFGDYVSVSDWAKGFMAFCYQENILDQSELDIQPAKLILRCEIAQMLYNLLGTAELL